MFLRFLITEGKCAAGLDAAIPSVAHWRLSDVVKGFVTPQLSRFFRLCQLPFIIVGAHVTQV
jgi:integrase/recombinase XerD